MAPTIASRPAPSNPFPQPRLPPNTSAKQFSQPLVHLHPAYLFELRDRLPKNAKALFLLRTLLKKVMLDDKVHSVTFSKRYGPGGPHAFLSFAPHFFPNVKQVQDYVKKYPGATELDWQDQVEWTRIDGKRTNDNGGATQSAEIGDVCSKVFLLALGYHFGVKFDPANAEQYAIKAHKLLWVFFGGPATAMLPEVCYGQYIRGSQFKSTNRPEGLLHVRTLIMISQVLPLLPPPPSPLSPHPFMHAWLARHIDFLQHHEVGTKGAARKNNIATHYHIQLVTHLVALNRSLEAHAIVAGFFFPSPAHTKGLSSRINPQGVPIWEVVRPTSFHYTAFELEPLTFLADLATNIRRYTPANGPPLVDVWEAENHALKRCLDFGLAYFLRSVPPPPRTPLPASVPKEVEAGADVRALVFQTRSVAARYGRQEYEWIVGKGGDGEMEPPGKGAPWDPIEPLKAWTVAGRLRWALLEGY